MSHFRTRVAPKTSTTSCSPVMFVGSSLQIDVLNDKFFVSLTRDAYTGSLNLESLSTMFPVKLHYLHAEYDFPGVDPPNFQGTARK